MTLQKRLFLLATLFSIGVQNDRVLAATIVLDFNSLPTTTSGGLNVGNPLMVDDYRLFDPSLIESFDYFLSFEDGWQNNRGSSNGTTTVFKLTNSSSEVEFELSSVSGSVFDLISIDVAEVFNVGDGSFSSAARTVTFTGNLNGGGVVGQTFDLDLVSDGQGGRIDFETITMSSGFRNLQSVVIAASSGHPTNTYLNFDNIVVSAVPEPTALLLALMTLIPLKSLRQLRESATLET